MYLFCICDILSFTGIFPHHEIDRCSGTSTLYSYITIVTINVDEIKICNEGLKYYAHTASHTISHPIPLVSHGQTATFAQVYHHLPCKKIVVWPCQMVLGMANCYVAMILSGLRYRFCLVGVVIKTLITMIAIYG